MLKKIISFCLYLIFNFLTGQEYQPGLKRSPSISGLNSISKLPKDYKLMIIENAIKIVDQFDKIVQILPARNLHEIDVDEDTIKFIYHDHIKTYYLKLNQIDVKQVRSRDLIDP